MSTLQFCKNKCTLFNENVFETKIIVRKEEQILI